MEDFPLFVAKDLILEYKGGFLSTLLVNMYVCVCVCVRGLVV